MRSSRDSRRLHRLNPSQSPPQPAAGGTPDHSTARRYGQIMTRAEPHPISIDGALSALTLLPNRTPMTSSQESKDAFALLSSYCEGGIYVGRWAGSSEWERHSAGEEIVMVLDGQATIFFLADDGEQIVPIGAGELVVVPQGTWHRLEAPGGVKILSVTPQPTDHSTAPPA